MIPIIIPKYYRDPAEDSSVKLTAEQAISLCEKTIAWAKAKREEAIQKYCQEEADRHNWWYYWFSFLGVRKWTAEDARKDLDAGGHGLAKGIEWDIFVKRSYEEFEEVANKVLRMAKLSADGFVTISRKDLDKIA
jgi:hypothetical protein